MDRHRGGALTLRLVAALLLGAGACSPLPQQGDYDEGDGEGVPVEFIAGGWETDFVPGGQMCAGELCCRMGVVEIADTQAQLEDIFERLFDGSRRAPPVDPTGNDLVMVVSNRACEGDERRYFSDGAVHDGPDLLWSLRLETGDRALEGPGRSFLVGRTPRLRYRSVLPELTVNFIGGEAD